MVQDYFLPHPLLREYVEIVVIVRIDFTTPGSLEPLYTFVPTHTRFLCFYLDDPVQVRKGEEGFVTRARSIIIGPQLTPVTLNLGKKHHAIIVGLKPGGMYRLLGVPMREIVDQDYDARLVMGREINELLDRLLSAKNNSDKNTITQQYLLQKLSRLKTAHPFDRVMTQLIGSKGNLPIEAAAARACLSIRQFERQCLDRIGLPPKLYARMVRFSHAYKLKENHPHMTWIDITHQCGYYDQMHLIRDFKAFAKFTPGMLLEKDIEKSVRFQTLVD